MAKLTIQEKIDYLKQEYLEAERQLLELQQKEKKLQDTLLRLSGAIDVLKELQNNQDPE